MTTKKYLGIAALALVACGGVSIATYALNSGEKEDKNFTEMFTQNEQSVKAASAISNVQPVDLTQAADVSVHAVVHIKATQRSRTQTVQEMPDIFDFFFGDGRGQQRQIQTQPRVGFGSGVIISDDGYIVTNSHVVEGADEITVRLNDEREFKGRVIGADAATDLALVKIEGKNFPTLPVGDSDALKVGEWVLAVGNPFNLNSTVTAGIVSAKARSISSTASDGKTVAIQSFIQTDAAINQGNSGGALVNSKGQLVGINAMLYSPTGAYSGYGFAIPTTIMKKVVADIKTYGSVQRAVLGIAGRSIGTDITMDDQQAEQMKKQAEELGVTDGVYLKNSQGNTKVTKSADIDILGAAFRPLPDDLKQQLGINYGLQVTGVSNGKMKDAGITKGFIILKANGTSVKTTDDLETILKEASNSPEQVLFMSGMYPSGKRANFAVDLSQE